MKAVLTRENATELLAICKEKRLSTFCLVKEQGVYFGDIAGGETVISYVDGFDPDVNDDWYEEATKTFGDEDFVKYLSLTLLQALVDDQSLKALELTITPTHIKVAMIAVNNDGDDFKIEAMTQQERLAQVNKLIDMAKKEKALDEGDDHYSCSEKGIDAQNNLFFCISALVGFDIIEDDYWGRYLHKATSTEALQFAIEELCKMKDELNRQEKG